MRSELDTVRDHQYEPADKFSTLLSSLCMAVEHNHHESLSVSFWQHLNSTLANYFKRLAQTPEYATLIHKKEFQEALSIVADTAEN